MMVKCNVKGQTFMTSCTDHKESLGKSKGDELQDVGEAPVCGPF